MLDWTQKHADWEGTAEELADVATEAAKELGLLELDEAAFNERLIRSYVQAGALDRPERRGREAWFGFRQLTQALVVRMLLNDGWPLARIADYMLVTDTAALLELLPKSAKAYAAQSLVRRYQRERSEVRDSAPPVRTASMPPTSPQSAPSKPGSWPSLMEQSADLLRRRNTAREVTASLAALCTPSETGIRVRLEIAPGCEVYVDRELARRITQEQADQLGAALGHALIDWKLATKGERK